MAFAVNLEIALMKKYVVCAPVCVCMCVLYVFLYVCMCAHVCLSARGGQKSTSY